MKTIKYLLLWSILFVSAMAQDSKSYIRINVLPYTKCEVNMDKSWWTFTANGAVIEQIEINVRNNTLENITSLSAKVLKLYDSTEIKIKLEPLETHAAIIYSGQFIDINPSVFATGMIGSQKFIATYIITTKQYQSIEEIVRSIIWTLEVSLQ